MKLFQALGLDIKILVAQLVNFAVLLFVLHRFGYKPMQKFLADRAEKIEKGIQTAEEAKKKLAEMEEKERQVLIEARKEAQKIISKAEEVARKNAQDIVAASKEQAETMKSNTEKQLELEKNKIMSEVKMEIAGLVVAATEKILGEKIDREKDRQLIEKSIK